MNEDGIKKKNLIGNLKKEWSLFWETFIEDEIKDEVLRDKIETLSPEQIEALCKAISFERKRLNQRLESLKKEIDLNSAKLEALKLVGGDLGDTIQNLNRLSDLGQEVSLQLEKVDKRLKIIRYNEDKLRNV